MFLEDVNLEEEGVGLLLPQFKNAQNIKATLQGPLAYLDSNVDTIKNIQEGVVFDNLTGDMLAKVGKLLNVQRGGLGETEYKSAITASIYINASDGTSKSLIKVLNESVGEGKYTFIESFPAEVQVRLYEPQNFLTEEIIGLLLPIGVKGVFFQNPYAGKTPWIVANVGDTNPEAILPDVADLNTTDKVMVDVIFT